MAFTSISAADIQVGDPLKQSLFQTIKDDLDHFNSTIGTFGAQDVPNGSFEIDSDLDNIPDTWSLNLYAGGSAAIVTSPAGGHGAKAYQFTQPLGASQGGGDLTSDYIPVYRNTAVPVGFQCSTSAATVVAKVIIKCYTAAKAANGADQTIWTSSGIESLDKSRVAFFIPNTGTFFVKIKLVGGEVGPSVSATVVFDNITIRPLVRRLEISSGTRTEVTTTSASWTNVGNFIVAINQKIYNANLMFLFQGDVKNTGTNLGWMRFSIGGVVSNEWIAYTAQYTSGMFMLVVDPAGADAFTVNLELKSNGTSTVYGQKLFAPTAIFVVDKSS